MITAFVGCVGARTRSKVALVLYMVCIGSSLALGVASTAQAFADASNVYPYARRQWNRMTIQQTQTFQQSELCCNFDTVPPCCRFAAGSGECANENMCYDIVEQPLLDNFHLIGATSLLQTIVLFAVFVMALVLYKITESYPNWATKSGT